MCICRETSPIGVRTYTYVIYKVVPHHALSRESPPPAAVSSPPNGVRAQVRA